MFFSIDYHTYQDYELYKYLYIPLTSCSNTDISTDFEQILFFLRYYGLHAIKDLIHMPSVLAKLSTAIIEFLFGIIMDGKK